MFKPRPCGCKGVRTCLVCETEFGIAKVNPETNSEVVDESLEFCHLCSDKAWPGLNVWKQHPNHSGQCFEFHGVYLQPDFLSTSEEELLVAGCDSLDWDLSQSGRRKQNFGPKTNFKKKKLNGKSFTGFPAFSKRFQDKLTQTQLLKDFITIEQCAIEYRPETGACIDPHIDDCWVWGERVVSVSLLSDSTLTMTKYTGPRSKYNLEYYYCLERLVNEDAGETETYPTVRILMPRCSLLVLYGAARYEWEHSILRRDIKDRRICMAYREFTKEYLPNGEQYEVAGKNIIEKSQQHWANEEVTMNGV